MLRSALRRAERVVGARLEGAVESPRGASALSALARLSLSSATRCHGVRAGVAHLVGVSARRDVSAVNARLALLERRIEDLCEKLEFDHDD